MSKQYTITHQIAEELLIELSEAEQEVNKGGYYMTPVPNTSVPYIPSIPVDLSRNSESLF